MPREDHVAEAGRLDAVLAQLTGLPRADVQRAITAGRVTVDGLSRPKSFRLAGGEALVIDLPEDAELEPEGPPVPVRHRDVPSARYAMARYCRVPITRRDDLMALALARDSSRRGTASAQRPTMHSALPRFLSCM